MSKPYRNSIFIFRRDYRLQDNTGLIAALKDSKKVFPLFVFDPRQTDPKRNPYFGEHSFRFLCESLWDLLERIKAKGGKLSIGTGEVHEVLQKILAEGQIDAVYVNRDYTPFSTRRDTKLAALCKKYGAAWHSHDDLILCDPEKVLNGSGEPYKVFTPFFKNAHAKKPLLVQKNMHTNYATKSLSGCDGVALLKKYAPAKCESALQVGGRTQARKELTKVAKLKTYNTDRDIPGIRGTSRLSAHLKFGTLSIREVYWYVRKKLGSSTQLISELYWRDFYAYVSLHFPHVFMGNFKPEYNDLSWDNDEVLFAAWKEGRTGFPIVDAGMRELNTTGWMHNRVRMIVASFLTKDLHIDWRWGERYFAQKLVDYDPSSNNGGWQWAAGTGADAAPYFRIFNPWSQQKKFDPDCVYIKKWLPELKHMTPERIHAIEKKGVLGDAAYPEPIVDHKIEREETLKRYKMLH